MPQLVPGPDADHLHLEAVEDLHVRLHRPARHRPRHRAGGDLRVAGSERCRQVDAHQHRLRHRHRQFGKRSGRRPRHRGGLPRRAPGDRPRAAGTDYRRLRDGAEHRELLPRSVRDEARCRAYRADPAGAVPLGQARQPADDPVGWDEAAGAHRQGAVARAPGAVPRRAHRRRRRGAAPGYVAPRARPAPAGRHRHSHHPLHRRGRGNGRPHRRDPPGRDHSGRGEGRADAQARAQAADPASPAADHRGAAGTRRLRPGALRGGERAGLYL